MADIILNNANDVAKTFFKGVHIDLYHYLYDWALDKIPTLWGLEEMMKEIRALGDVSNLTRDQILNLKTITVKGREYPALGANIVHNIELVARSLGFVRGRGGVTGDAVAAATAYRRNQISYTYPDFDVFWSEIWPFLAKNRESISESDWLKIANNVEDKVTWTERRVFSPSHIAELMKPAVVANVQNATAPILVDQKSIYNTIIDHIKLNANIYTAAAAATIATALAYYLYKLYKSGVPPQKIKAKVLQDSRRVDKLQSEIKTSKSSKEVKKSVSSKSSRRKISVTNVRRGTSTKSSILHRNRRLSQRASTVKKRRQIK